jgi:hypothetical protein
MKVRISGLVVAVAIALMPSVPSQASGMRTAPLVGWAELITGTPSAAPSAVAARGDGSIVSAHTYAYSGASYGSLVGQGIGNYDGALLLTTDAEGDVLWAWEVDGAYHDEIVDVVAASDGSVYALVRSALFSESVELGRYDLESNTVPPEQRSSIDVWYPGSGAAIDTILIKFDATGALEWSSVIGWWGDDVPGGLALDSQDNVYVSGAFKGSAPYRIYADMQQEVAYESGGHNVWNAFLAKYDPTGTVVWVSGIRSAGNVQGVDVAVLADDDPIVLANVPGLPTGPLPEENPGIAVARFAREDGSMSWLHRFAAKFPTAVVGTFMSGGEIAAAPDGTFYVAGESGGTVVFGDFEVLTHPASGTDVARDVYVARLTGQGIPIGATVVGSQGWDGPRSLEVLPSGQPVVSGFFEGFLDLPGGGSLVGEYGRDGFVVWLASDLSSAVGFAMGGVQDDETTGAVPLSDGGTAVIATFVDEISIGDLVLSHDAPSVLTSGVLAHVDTPDLPLSPRFRDVPFDHPFYDEIEWLAVQGYVQGFDDATFRPVAAITRQSMAAVLWRQAGSPPPPTDAASFSDVPPTNPFAPAIAWLTGNGLANGYPDGTYRPSAPISRQTLAAFLWRSAGEPSPDESAPSFSDVPPGHLFEDAIRWLAQHEVVTGYPDGSFQPGYVVSRQTLAAFLQRWDTCCASVP